MKNAQQLRDELSRVFSDLRTGAITNKDAAEFANLAGKMINSAKVQVEYYSIRDGVEQDQPMIGFLEEPTAPRKR